MGVLRWVALDVADEDGYARYRAAMLPVLRKHGGSFSLDCRVSESMTAPVDHAVNRLIAIHFPDGAAMDAFYVDPAYAEARRLHFAGSVVASTVLGVMPGA